MPPKVNLTFCGGVNEVGGNQVFFEDLEYDVKLFLDFGINVVEFSRKFDPYEEPTSPDQLTKLFLLPKGSKLTTKNLYSRYYIFDNDKMNYIQKVQECKGETDPPTNIDGVLISHPHRDHYYGIGLLNRNIPIYTGVVTHRIIKAYADASRSVMSNFYEGLTWKLFRTGQVININGLRIFPVHVDHSIPAAYGFIIDSSVGVFVYSGDFRMHGPLSNMTRDLIERAQNIVEEKQLVKKENNEDITNQSKKIRCVICEGTQINRGAIESEQIVEEELVKLMDKNPFDYFLVKYNRLDWDRFRSFAKIANEYDFKYIITEKDAYFYYLLNEKAIYDTMRDPDILNDDNIFVLIQYKERYPWQKQIRDIFEKEEKIWRLVNEADLRDFKNFFLYTTHLYHNLLENLPKDSNGAFISSDIDPYSEEYLNNTHTIMREVEGIGVPSYRIHASGHAKPHDIINYITELNPSSVIPVHTEHSKFFKQLFKNYDIDIILPEHYETITFD